MLFESRVPNKYFMRTWVQILGGFVSIGCFLSFLLLSLVELYFSVILSSIVLNGRSVLFFSKNLSLPDLLMYLMVIIKIQERIYSEEVWAELYSDEV